MNISCRLTVLFISICSLAACEKDSEEETIPKTETNCYVLSYEVTGNDIFDSAIINLAYNTNKKIIRIDESYDGEQRGHTEYIYDADNKLLRSNVFDEDMATAVSYNVYEYNNTNLVSNIYYHFLSRDNTQSITKYTYKYNKDKQVSSVSVYTNDRLNNEITFIYNSAGQIVNKNSIRYFLPPMNSTQSTTEYLYQNGLLIKSESGTSNKTIQTYEYGDGKHYLSSTIKNNPIIFNYPIPSPTNYYIKSIIKQSVTNERDEVTDDEFTYTAKYEYNQFGFPIKSTSVDHRKELETTVYKYDCM